MKDFDLCKIQLIQPFSKSHLQRHPKVPNKGWSPPGRFQAARKPAYCVTMISGPGVDSARPRPINICWVESHPFAAFHHFLMHDGDLTRRPTEADESQLGPELQGFLKRNRHGC